jgi:hypothetical protein
LERKQSVSFSHENVVKQGTTELDYFIHGFFLQNLKLYFAKYNLCYSIKENFSPTFLSVNSTNLQSVALGELAAGYIKTLL